MDTVVAAIENAFIQKFDVSFEVDEPDTWEKKTIREFTTTRYTNPDWIFSHKHPRSSMGISAVKTPGGLLEIYLALAGNTIEHIMITGDFFSTTKDINLLESSLKWTSAKREKIEEHLSEVWRNEIIYGVSFDTLTEAILQAKENLVTT